MAKYAVFQVLVTANGISQSLITNCLITLTVNSRTNDPEHDNERRRGVHHRPPLNQYVRAITHIEESSKRRTGVTKGLPINAIIDQSKVTTLMPNPENTPNSALTVMFSGAIQHTQLKKVRAWNK